MKKSHSANSTAILPLVAFFGAPTKPQVVQTCFPLAIGSLLLSHWARNRQAEPGPLRALIVGLAQAAALIPGISRSGTTIVTGRYLGVSPERAAEFSLLMAVPLLLGATVVGCRTAVTEGLGDLTVASLMTGFVLSGLVGYLAIHGLVRALRVGRFWLFGFYCLAAGTAGVIWTAIGS